MKRMTITMDSARWRQLLSMLSEITHGSTEDQMLIGELEIKIKNGLEKRQGNDDDWFPPGSEWC